ncbi:MAG: hypothetical protein GAK29_03978 [Acinetobacter bereziniae]|uniref:DUF1905 domain-containing protein n=1 Tax=Acinetobacter bereziniae TaxID=106648 RepID=A0A833PCA7_ACIBZ|nr:MAG: hypothetical protein GAK29_03978 [Acinetobacter bereziniae]
MIDNKIQLSVESTVQRYSGAGGWHYVIVPKQQAMEIKNYLPQRQSWGLVSVTVTVGQSVWKT